MHQEKAEVLTRYHMAKLQFQKCQIVVLNVFSCDKNVNLSSWHHLDIGFQFVKHFNNAIFMIIIQNFQPPFSPLSAFLEVEYFRHDWKSNYITNCEKGGTKGISPLTSPAPKIFKALRRKVEHLFIHIWMKRGSVTDSVLQNVTSILELLQPTKKGCLHSYVLIVPLQNIKLFRIGLLGQYFKGHMQARSHSPSSPYFLSIRILSHGKSPNSFEKEKTFSRGELKD